jgi:ribokinase
VTPGVTPPLVVVVGDAAFDYTIEVPAQPTPDEKVPVVSSSRALGGTGANAAAQVVKLGGRCELVSVVGDDLAGDWILAELHRTGVGTELVARAPGNSTTCTIVHGAASSSDGFDRRVFVDIGVGREISVAPSELQDAERIYVSYAPQVIVPLIEQGLGPRLIVGLEHWMVDESVLDTLTQVGLVLTNEAGAVALRDAERALEVPIVVTNGSRNVELRQRGSVVETFPTIAADVVDATGAGDAFAGALTFALASGSSLAESIRLSVVVAGLSTARVGAQVGQPDAEAVRAFGGPGLLPDR